MRRIVDVSEAEARLEELVVQVEAGEEVLICRDGAPVARLNPIDAERRRAEIKKTIDAIRDCGDG
jgi:prevent-host-death family protein